MPIWGFDGDRAKEIMQSVEGLLHPNAEVRKRALDALARMDPRVMAGLPALIHYLNEHKYRGSAKKESARP